MKKRCVQVLGLITIFVGAGCPPRTFDPPDGDVLFSDDFDADALAEGWTFDGDADNLSLTARRGFARVLAEPGLVGDDPEGLSILLRDHTGDFVLTTRMEFDPAADRHVAGLLVEDDNGRRLSFGLLKASGPRGSFRGVVPIVDEPSERDIDPATLAFDGDSLYLRMQRTLDEFELAYSEDGTTYTRIGTVFANFADRARVGVGAAIDEDCNAACDDIAPADFDFFEITSVE